MDTRGERKRKNMVRGRARDRERNEGIGRVASPIKVTRIGNLQRASSKGFCPRCYPQLETRYATKHEAAAEIREFQNLNEKEEYLKDLEDEIQKAKIFINKNPELWDEAKSYNFV